MTDPFSESLAPTPRGRGWARESLAGLVGTLAVLAVPLTLGVLAFAALGANAAVATGVPAAFATLVIGGAIYALLGSASMPAAGPSSATALILAALVARLAADPQLSANGSAVPAIVALCGATLLLCGALQIVFALVGMGTLARFVPQPVLAGFMNGVALLILVGQLPALLGLPPGTAITAERLAQAAPGALMLGAASAAAVWLIARRWPGAPATLLALVAGVLVHAGATLALPGFALGGTLGVLPWPGVWPDALRPLREAGGMALLQAHASAVGGTGLVLALIGTLESALNTTAVDQLRATRHDPRRELLAIGCANIAGGVVGGLPLVALRARALAIVQAGGTGRRAVLGGTAAMALLFVAGTPLLALLPHAVLAGIMVTTAVALVDRWSGRLLAQWWAGRRSRELRPSLGIVAAVCLTTLWQGFAAGVALGVLLSLLVFVSRINRSLVRARYTAAEQPSRRIYPAAAEALLQPLRRHILVFELSGALFFGSGEQLLHAADALDADCRCLVLDLKRVGTIDESGAVMLQQLNTRLRRRGVELLLAGVAAGSAAARALRAFADSEAAWPDADRAIEAAERRLLGAAWPDAQATTPLADCALLQGLDAPAQALLSRCMPQRRLAAGERLFAEGDAADGLYVLTQGSISIIGRHGRDGSGPRLLSASPGMMLGETAMLDGGGRSAEAVADTDAMVHWLSAETLAALMREQPALAAMLYRNIAVHLSQRLRGASTAWRASAS